MKLNLRHEITFDTEETIAAAAASGPDQIVLLLGSGDVTRYTVGAPNGEYLFSVNSSFTYEDGGFDTAAPATICTLDEIVVVVNDYKRHGYVHYPEKYQKLHLWRKDYYVGHCRYPIALFKDPEGIPHLIYSEDWNHLQIMNLDTRQVLTAAKSLIEVDAEEQHLRFYERHSEENKLPWPRPYDYFFGKLQVSPDSRSFLSAGWHWGSWDAYRLFDIGHFIANNRIKDLQVCSGEHENRAVCWIDSETIAAAFDPLAEDDEYATPDSPCEIRFHRIAGEHVEVVEKIAVPGYDIVHAELFHIPEHSCLLVFSEKIGILLLSLKGAILFHDPAFTPDAYHPQTGLLTKIREKTVRIYEIVPG